MVGTVRLLLDTTSSHFSLLLRWYWVLYQHFEPSCFLTLFLNNIPQYANTQYSGRYTEVLHPYTAERRDVFPNAFRVVNGNSLSISREVLILWCACKCLQCASLLEQSQCFPRKGVFLIFALRSVSGNTVPGAVFANTLPRKQGLYWIILSLLIISFDIIPVASDYQEIHPYSAMTICSVKINTFL